MIRVTAHILRFIAGCRGKSNPSDFLSRLELDEAALAVARSSQCQYFRTLHNELSHDRLISVKTIARLRPYIDEKGLIHVGGRISKSNLPESQKHQILLAKTSHFSLLLIRHWHDVTGHSGP
ncbi:uncharacterized protein LOC112683827 [Sipha flava]|uniref:Uncharacterized protein LOC112683827 n=1 Tax=Sipha flava TaxID=143950 RepID=A0A8B8FJW5_9HEMI|nr:uncharacterized protein LOC112683827 [Sipha flava]